MIDLNKIEKILNERGWYSLATRLCRPESRAPEFQQEWTDELLKKYLILHCGKTEAGIILGDNNPKFREILARPVSDFYNFLGICVPDSVYWQVAICVREPLETLMDRAIIGLMREHLDIKSENE